MRITRESLLKITREMADQYARQDRSIVAIYAIGSLLSEEPLLGGTADIDLVFVHDSAPPSGRELVRLSDEVHLDILHHGQGVYHQARQLRLDPFIGPAIYATPLVLHDTQHWFDFTSASARSQFTRPENTIARARPFAEKARRCWMERHEPLPGYTPDDHPAAVLKAYLNILEPAANAIACLSGGLLPVRRFMGQAGERGRGAGLPDLSEALAGLLSRPPVEAELLHAWLPRWSEAFFAAGQQSIASLELHPYRLPYYRRAIEALIESPEPAHALWPLLYTWSLALQALPAGSPHEAAWLEAAEKLGLSPADVPERWGALDAFLDRVEEKLDTWALENGA